MSSRGTSPLEPVMAYIAIWLGQSASRSYLVPPEPPAGVALEAHAQVLLSVPNLNLVANEGYDTGGGEQPGRDPWLGG